MEFNIHSIPANMGILFTINEHNKITRMMRLAKVICQILKDKYNSLYVDQYVIKLPMTKATTNKLLTVMTYMMEDDH
jgi:hypothetical protein